MSKILLLSPEVRSRIAAGEVIERPLSVIKELIENSIDAGATKIKVITKKGGKTLIKVIDNGEGISKTDLELCALRHSTSKIRTDQDIYNVLSLGFRGEALASMTAVGKLTIMSKQLDCPGYATEYDNLGKMLQINEHGMEKGTIIQVESLFTEIPVRLKTLRSDDVEEKMIVEIIHRFALSYPHVRFEYLSDKTNYIYPVSTLQERVHQMFGRDVSVNVLSLNYERDAVKVTGYVTKPTYTRKNKTYQYFFVNGRYINSKQLTKSVYKAYDIIGKLFLDRHPCFVINIEINPQDIDVNIHPAKLEIKFVNDVTTILSNAVYTSLKTFDNIPSANVQSGSQSKTKQIYLEKTQQLSLPIKQSTNLLNVKQSPVSLPKLKETSDGWNKLSPIRVLGIVNKMYIVGADLQGLLLIDQHASEERINFEKLHSQFKNRKVKVQDLLIPVTITVSRSEKMIIESNIDKFKRMGFELKVFGIDTFSLITVPSLLLDLSSEQLNTIILDMLVKINLPEDRLYNVVASKSCRMSIKAGDYISVEYANDLLRKLDKCSNPFTCPHGRPTLIRFNWSDLEQKFNRKS